MTRGNQRELARVKNQKKVQDQQKKKGANDKDPNNKNLNLEQRKQRDADLMRQKQMKATNKEDGAPSGIQ